MSGNSAKGVANKTDAHDTPRAQYPPSIAMGATRVDRQLSARRQGDLNDRNGARSRSPQPSSTERPLWAQQRALKRVARWFHRPPRSWLGVSAKTYRVRRSVVEANPISPPQPIPLWIDQAVPAWGMGRLSPAVQCAAVSRGRAPSTAVSIASSSRRLPCGEHRDAPVATTLRRTVTLARDSGLSYRIGDDQKLGDISFGTRTS